MIRRLFASLPSLIRPGGRQRDKAHAQIILMRDLIVQSEMLNRTVTLAEVIDTVGNGALALSKADRLAIFLQKDKGEFYCAWSRNLPPGFIEAVLGSPGYLPGIWNSSNREPILIPDITHHAASEETRRLFQLGEFQAACAWPLVYEKQASAYVCCFYNYPVTWAQESLEILEAFFRQAAVSVENARLFESECAQRRLAEALRDAAATLNSTLDLDKVLDGILASLRQVVSHDAAGIMLLEGQYIRPIRWHGIPESSLEAFSSWRYPLEELHNRQVMVESLEAVVIPDTTRDEHWVFTRGLEWVRSYAGAPICQRGEVTGFIDVMSSIPGFYAEDVGEILQAFAVQAAIALENARLYQNTHQRMAETRALYRALAPLFNSVEDLHLLSNQITESVMQEFSSAHCSLLLLDEEGKNLHIVSQAGPLRLCEPILPLDGPGLTVAAARTGQTIYSPDVAKEPNYVSGSPETRSELAIPLHVGGRLIGVLNLESPEVDAFDERGRALLVSFAERAALGLENARLYKAAQQRARELEALHTATTSLVSTLDLQELLERILAAARSAIPSAEAAILHLWTEDQRLSLRVQQGLTEEQIESLDCNDGSSPWSWVIRNRQPLLLGEGAQLPAEIAGYALCGAWENQSLLIAPLVQEDQPLGVISLISPDPQAFDEQALRLLISFASTATAAIHNAQLHSAVQYLAVTDPLTGVVNRRGFFDQAQKMVDQAVQNHRSLAAVMIDIDFFKLVNDSYGHDIGDLVLRTLADRCRRLLRDSDLICRYGGEEFLILLADSDMRGAYTAAQRLLNSITNIPFETKAGQVQVTVSIGVAAFNDDCQTLADLLKQADIALYRAKAEGRNRVCAWSSCTV